MDLRERRRDSREWLRPDPSSDGGSGALDASREAADRFLRAGDAAIDQALSRDSETFLRAIRQEGGE